MKPMILKLFTSPLGPCPQFTLTDPPEGTYSCPGRNISYTCVIESSAQTVVTTWSGLAFHCSPTNQIPLIQSIHRVTQPYTPVTCGSLSAVTTNVNSSCYTSVLTIPAEQALNGTTVMCGDANTLTIVGSDTLKIISECTLH